MVVVDGTADQVPRLGNSLPLVDQNGLVAGYETAWVTLCHFPLGGSSSRWMVFARQTAVAVLPMPFGPSMATAAILGSNSSSSSSMTRRM